MPDAGQLELAQLLCKADSYLSLVLHRHLKPDTPDDLRREIDAVVGALRRSYVTTQGTVTGLAASPSPVSAPSHKEQEEIHVTRVESRTLSDPGELPQQATSPFAATLPENYYGCVACQSYHFEGDSLYQDHLWRQSKHGIQRGLRPTPPEHIIDFAVEMSGWSPCRSKRGVVIFQGADIIAHGYNYKPRGFDCDGSEACKATCRVEAVHAEQQALLSASSRASGCEMIHVKTVDGQLVPSGGPSCVQCSKLVLVAGIAGVWLYQNDGWHRYSAQDFHCESLTNSERPRADPRDGLSGTQAETSQPSPAPSPVPPAELKQAIAWALGEDTTPGAGLRARATLASYMDALEAPAPSPVSAWQPDSRKE